MSQKNVAREMETLRFAFLVYPEVVKPGRRLWFAVSVLTSQSAHGENADEAIQSLVRGIEGCIGVAQRHRMSARDWFKSTRAAEPKFVAEFCRLALDNLESRRSVLDDCVLEAKIATAPAA